MFGITPFERSYFLDPFRNFERDFFKSFEPSRCRTDIKDEGDKYILECEMPGFDKDDISVDVEGTTLTLRAEKSSAKDEENSGSYIRRERSYGSYSRSFDITDIDEKAIDASYSNGVLTLCLPKSSKNKSEPRRIEIKQK